MSNTIYTKKTWVVYLTIYSGKLLPRRYIGYTYQKKIDTGYNGTPTSQKYGAIYEAEQKNNKHLFKSRVVNRFDTQDNALAFEAELQTKYDVVESDEYFNMVIGNKTFGNRMMGDDNPSRRPEERLKKSLKMKEVYKNDPSIRLQQHKSYRKNFDLNNYYYRVEFFTGDYKRVMSIDMDSVPHTMFQGVNTLTPVSGSESIRVGISTHGIFIYSSSEISDQKIKEVVKIKQEEYNTIMRFCSPKIKSIEVDGKEWNGTESGGFKNIRRKAAKNLMRMFKFKGVEYTPIYYTDLFNMNTGGRKIG